MKRNRRNQTWLAAAPPAVALALAAAALPAAALAQEEQLPSVSDYRLPEPSARPSGRASTRQGPVDRDNPVVLRPTGEPAAAESGAAAQSPEPSPAAAASPAADPAPSPATTAARPAGAAASAGARPAASAGTSASVRPQVPASPGGILAPAPASTTPSAAAGSAPSQVAPIGTSLGSPSITWKVHSAQDVPASPIWPWLAGIGVLLASNILLLLVLLRRRRARVAADLDQAEYAEEVQAPAMPEPAAPQLVTPEPARIEPVAAPVTNEAREEALDLLDILAHPVPETQPAAQPAGEEQAPRPTLGVIVNPLEVTLAVRRLSATLMNTVLNYELVIANRSDQPIGPVTVAGDMIGAHASIPERSQLEMNGHAIVPQHRIEALAAGESATVNGEFRLALTAITPIRSGNASLFVPLARFRVEAMREGAPPLSVNRTFVIGESQDRPGAALKPFRLDLGPRLYSHIGQREVAATG